MPVETSPLVQAAEQLLDERVELGGGRDRDFDLERNRRALGAVLTSGQFSPDDVHGAITRLMTQGCISPHIGYELRQHSSFSEIEVRIGVSGLEY